MAGDEWPWVQQHRCCDSRLQRQHQVSTHHLVAAAQGSGGTTVPRSVQSRGDVGTRVSGGLSSAGGVAGLDPGTIKAGKALCDSASPAGWVFFVSSGKDPCCRVT